MRLLTSAGSGRAVPLVYYLSGLTCTDENFVTKAGHSSMPLSAGVACGSDTSPRGEGVADDPEGSYDMGLGAGFTLTPPRPLVSPLPHV
ncbi:MAG: hypothetical protein CM15mP103_12830 [Gammaproteobacteria bacterium]|nr:MAG: hypothetical protein CM15mP103_12830 [Gammaproteobacteria bacterium]